MTHTGHAKSDGDVPANSLHSALTAGGISAWINKYQLPCTQDRNLVTFRAASQSAFQIIILTPNFISSPICCLHLASALNRPAHHSLIYVDMGCVWDKDGCGRSLQVNCAERLIQSLRAKGMRVVCNMQQLVKHVDARMCCMPEGSAEGRWLEVWWRGKRRCVSARLKNARGAAATMLARPDRYMDVLALCVCVCACTCFAFCFIFVCVLHCLDRLLNTRARTHTHQRMYHTGLCECTHTHTYT